MTTENETDKAIKQIRHLLNHTVENGCTEKAAYNAAEMVGKLLKVYNLSMSEVYLGQQKCVEKTVKLGRERRHPISGCTNAIARFCDCKNWVSGGDYVFFGLESDTEMAAYLFDLIFKAMETELREFKQGDIYQKSPTHGKTLTVSFQKGMASRIADRLDEMADVRHDEENEAELQRKIDASMAQVANTESGASLAKPTSIVLLKKSKVEDDFEKLGIRLRRTYTRSNVNYGGYGAGRAAGGKVNLNRPLGGGGGSPRGLLA